MPAPAPPPAGPSPRACGRRARPLPPGAARPTSLLAAFFLTAIAFLIAGAVAGTLNAAGAAGWYGRWLALHLALLGGVSLLVIGAAQFFATAFLATAPPGRRMVGAQLAAWVAGTALVAVGVPTGRHALTDAGGIAILGALVLFAVALWRLERRALQQARWALRWYYACAGSLGLGALAGVLMARGTVWTHGSLLGAHLSLNLAGWLGTAIVGTLHTFFPSLTHTRLRHPRLQGPAFLSWTSGVAALAGGFAAGADAAVALGWGLLALGAVLLGVNLAASARAATGPLGLPARLVGAAQPFLLAGLAVALAAAIADGPQAPAGGPWRPVMAVLLLAGWVGMTVAGSLLHLLAVLHRVRNLARAMPAPAPRRDTALAAAAAAAVAVLAVSRAPGIERLDRPAAVAVLAVAVLIGARVLVLAARGARLALPGR